MKYYKLAPEVAGGLGERSVLDTATHPPRVERLHYELQGWLGDDLLESFPCFIVTDRLRAELIGSGLTGFELAAVEITRSSEFDELYPGREVPRFHWLQITGEPGRSDFWINSDHELVASKTALAVLQRVQIRNCDMELLDEA